MYNKELVAPCGLYCGVCGIYRATADNDHALKEKLAQGYGLKVEDINCSGCLSPNPFTYCRVCSIKSCAQEKNLEGCHRCSEFPCDKVENFPFAPGKENIMRAVPRWRELGTEAWVKEEEALFSCKSCGKPMFRGAKKCRSCGNVQ